MQGKVFGKLTVVSRVVPSSPIKWRCQCECGTTVKVLGSNLRAGHTRSCGCLQREHVLRLTFKHGKMDTPTYRSWKSMKRRCNAITSPQYKDYGGRGIKVCKRWNESFLAFLEDMGERPPGMTLDRKNNDKGYTKKNCRWATRSTQNKNRRG